MMAEMQGTGTNKKSIYCAMDQDTKARDTSNMDMKARVNEELRHGKGRNGHKGKRCMKRQGKYWNRHTG